MSSDTSAYLSSQSVITETITAGIWEVPEVLACGEGGLTDQLPGEESEPITEDKTNQSQDEAVNDAMIGEGIEVVCGDQSDAPDKIGESKEMDCKKADALESAEEVMTDCKVEGVETEKAAENPEASVIEKEKAAEDIEAPVVDKEKAAEEVKTPATDKEKEENAPENIETPAIEKENEVKPQNESITEKKTVEKNDGVEPAVNESKENEGQKSDNGSLTQPNSND